MNVIGAIFFALMFLGAIDGAWGQSDDRAKQIEAAKKEGKIRWYTSTNLTESKPLLDDFEKQYPFIKGEIFRASGEKTLNRIATETRAGRWDFDLVTISEVDALQDAKMLASYKSPEARSYIPEFKDPNGYWTAVYTNYATIGYNNQARCREGCAEAMGRSFGPEMARQDFHRSGAVFLVRHAAQGLGQRAGAEVHARAGEAEYRVAQRPHSDRAAYVGGGVSGVGHLRAPHRGDEAARRAHRMGEYRQSAGGDVELRRLERETAASEHGAVVHRFSSVQARATAFARAQADSRAA